MSIVLPAMKYIVLKTMVFLYKFSNTQIEGRKSFEWNNFSHINIFIYVQGEKKVGTTAGTISDWNFVCGRRKIDNEQFENCGWRNQMLQQSAESCIFSIRQDNPIFIDFSFLRRVSTEVGNHHRHLLNNVLWHTEQKAYNGTRHITYEPSPGTTTDNLMLCAVHCAHRNRLSEPHED
jgi:hypothetical protein